MGGFGFRCGRDADRFEGVNFKIGKIGTRIVLDYTVAYLEAEVIKEVDAGTHTLFIGKVVDAQILSDDDPMTYTFYHEIKRGITPKSAPTDSTSEKQEKRKSMTKYRCKICGYICDPKKETQIQERSQELLLNSCPICGATKDQFEETD